MKRLILCVFIIFFLTFPLQAEIGDWFVEGELELYFEYWPAASDVQGSLLLIHGLGGSTFSWRKISPALAEAGFNVYAVDLPAFGRSPGKEELDLSRAGYAEKMWSFWKEQKPAKPWYFFGHSMGGGVALQMLAQKEDEEIAGLVLVAPAIGHREASFWSNIFRLRPIRRLGGWIMESFFLNEDRVEETLFSAYGRAPTPEEFAAYYKPLARPGALEFIFKMTADNLKRPAKLPEQIEEKVLLIWGEEDTWVPPPAQEELKLFSSYELQIIPGGGHLIMETHWEEVIAHISSYLGGFKNDPH